MTTFYTVVTKKLTWRQSREAYFFSLSRQFELGENSEYQVSLSEKQWCSSSATTEAIVDRTKKSSG